MDGDKIKRKESLSIFCQRKADLFPRQMDNAGAITTDHDDFLAGLALLHSTDLDSAEKLRRMLDALIARKCGPEKTLGVRMALGDSSTIVTELTKNEPKEMASGTLCKYEIDGIAIDDAKKRIDSIIIEDKFYPNIHNLIVAVDSKTEIPTISIPDDPGSASAGDDGALCKVCNGGRLGPLILLECQECQDVYHPLCHDPPVLDLDIYDPRLVWHCANCVELSELDSILVVDGAAEIQDKKHQRERRKKNQIIDPNARPKAQLRRRPNYFHGKVKSSLEFEPANGTTTERSKHFGSTSSRNDQPLATTFSNTISAPFSFSGHNQMRKRVGSKLTMTRATANK